jgi:WD40 repeat protein
VQIRSTWLTGTRPDRIAREPRELGSFDGEVTALVTHPSNDLLLIGLSTGAVVVFDPTQAAPLNVLQAHRNPVAKLLFTPDGDRFLSGAADGVVTVWNGAGEKTKEFSTGDAVTTFEISPDGKLLATGGPDRIPRIWDWENGELVAALPQQPESISACTWIGPDALLTGDIGGGVTLWQPSLGRFLRRIRAHEELVSQMIVSASKQWWVTASWDRTMKVWNNNYKERYTLPESSHAVNLVCLTPEDDLLLAACLDGFVRVWETHTGKLRDEFQASGSPLGGLAVLAGGQFVITGDEKGVLRAWAIEQEGGARYLHRHAGEIYDLAYTPDNVHLLSVGWDGQLKVWDRNDRQEIGYIQIHDKAVTSVSVSPDNAFWAVGAADGSVKIWDVQQQTFDASLSPHRESVSCVRFPANRPSIITAGWDMKLRCTSVKAQICEMTFDGHNKEVSSCELSPCGRRMVSGSWDGQARIWSLEKWDEFAECLLVLEGHAGAIFDVCFSPDGSRVATACADGVVRIWSAEKPSEPQQLLGHETEVTCVRFTPDGVLLLSADRRGEVRFWDASTGTPLGELEHDRAILALAISPDGAQVAVGDEGGGVRFLEVEYPAEPIWQPATVKMVKPGLWRYGAPMVESYHVTCVYCGQSQEREPEQLGAVYRCPKCRGVLRICPRPLLLHG